MSIYYVDLGQNSTGESGVLPIAPMGFVEFIAATSNSSYEDDIFKLMGTVDTVDPIELSYFNTLEQWVVGNPWRIRADTIQIGPSKYVVGGILCSNLDLTGDLIYDNETSFYSCYIICKTFKSVGDLYSIKRCFIYGCTVDITYQLYFPLSYSQVVSFNSIIKIGSVEIEGISNEEIDFRSSVINLNTSDFLTSFKERSDNNTNQFGWAAPVTFPKWDTCVESDFNFSKIFIEASGGPYTKYELGLFSSIRTGLGATGKVSAPLYIDFVANIQSGAGPLEVTFTPKSYISTAIDRFIWNFGDGVKSSRSNPTHVYNHGGNFSPVLEVVFSGGFHYKKVKKDFISVYKVKIVPSENSGNPPLTIQFFTEASLPKGIAVDTYDWDFGDGSPHSTDAIPTHVYSTAGNYPVNLKNTFVSS